MVKLSVIIPIYNSEKSLEKCIKSILLQTFDNFELLLIDDGSVDLSLNICNQYKKIDSRIKIFTQKNQGPSMARNNGIVNSSGEYLLFVDSDDYIEKNCLKKMMDNIENDKSDICICGYNIINNENKKNINIENTSNQPLKELIFNKKANILGYPWGKLVKKNKIKHFFQKEISIKEDLVFWLENSENIQKISIINEPLYNYVTNGNSLLNSKTINNKKLSVLKANEFIINYNVPEYIKYNEIYEFLINYLLFKAIGSKKIVKAMELEYSEKFKNYYKIYMKSNCSFKNKIKVFIKRRLFIEYKLFKQVKK